LILFRDFRDACAVRFVPDPIADGRRQADSSGASQTQDIGWRAYMSLILCGVL